MAVSPARMESCSAVLVMPLLVAHGKPGGSTLAFEFRASVAAAIQVAVISRCATPSLAEAHLSQRTSESHPMRLRQVPPPMNLLLLLWVCSKHSC